MPDENLDVNKGAESSEAQSTDVNVQPAAESSDQAATSTREQVEKQIDDYAKKAIAEDSDSSSEAESQEGEKTEATQAQPVEGEEKTEDQQAEDKGPIPYERFAEVNQAKSTLEQQVNEMQPIVQAHQTWVDHCIRNNIQPEEFQYWMDVAALAKTNPQEALKKLSPQLEVLQGFTGDVLPKDLKDAVERGEISIDYAKRLAATENQVKFNQNQAKFTQEQLAAQQQRHYEQEVRNAVGSWIGSKQKLDPDFKPKKDANAPDGKFELFINKYGVEAKSAKTIEDLIQIAERAYTSVETTVKSFIPKPNGHRVVKTTQSTSRAPMAPKTVEDVARNVAAKHGITFTPQRM